MKKKALNICVLGSTYPRFDKDSEVPWLRKTVELIKNSGHNVKVVASAYQGGKSHQIDGVEVLRFRYAPSSIEKLTHDEGAPSKVKGPVGKLLALSYIICGTFQMLVWCHKYRFDIINVHWPFPHGLFTILPKLLFGTKVVVTAHGAGMAMARKSLLLKAALKLSMLSADAATTNSSHTQHELKRLSGYDSQVIPYGATVSFKEGKLPLQGNLPVKILFSGRHIQRKGVNYLIEALPAVLQQRKVELAITGHGDRTEEWKARVRQLGLEDSVNFLGFVSNQELSKCYQHCDIYCLPAIFDDNDDTEGLGVVLIEALLHGRPVIASEVGGIVDVIKHKKTGILVNEKNPTELSNAILELINNPELAQKLGKQGQNFVNKEFNWQTIVNQVVKLFEETVATTPTIKTLEAKPC